MPFYEVLKILMVEPGKRSFRRKMWDNNKSCYPKFICSIGITPMHTKIVNVHGDNMTGYTFSPTAGDITADDWYEVTKNAA